jgi:phenazine biosynthesis protein phzE
LPPAGQPFALIRRGASPVVEVLTGEVRDVAATGDIPLESRPVLAMVPFRQIAERGFDVVDDYAPLRCLIVTERRAVPVAELLAELPAAAPAFQAEGFDIADADYAEQVKQVIAEEIGRGQGANFVLHRSFRGRIVAAGAADGGAAGAADGGADGDAAGAAGGAADAREAVLAWMAALLRGEQGAYWTYAVWADGLAFAGASPERHLTIKAGVVTMNPISGTYRHPPAGPTVPGLLSFLTDAKEVDELFMVVDEELKLMSAVCPSGGRMIGPYLKPMSQVTHTEYLLEGLTEADPRQVLRQTMFAPTVTGAPMQNACAVIARRERRPRGYYAGVLALFEPGPGGVWDLDAPILIRTAYVDPAGRVTVPAGATLVRHSDPLSEVAETRTKAAGMLRAIGAAALSAPDAAPPAPSPEPGGAGPGQAPGPPVAGDPQVKATLLYRNERLAEFWLRPQPSGASPLVGIDVAIVDAEDHFSQMLAHLLRRLGATVRVESWRAYRPGGEHLVIPGPGPGDPAGGEPRIERLRHVIGGRLNSGRPFLAVCLSHQILARHLGLDLRQLTRPHQGEQLTDELFGAAATLGYYNTFTAVAPLTPPAGVEVVRRRGTDEVIALRGWRFASLQGHPESALSPDGLGLLARLIPALVR